MGEDGGIEMKGGLGNMPLTLFVITSGVILFLYIRRANLGIDTHPGEGKSVTVQPKKPSVFIPLGVTIPTLQIPKTPEEAGIHLYPWSGPSSNGGGVLSP